MSWKNSTYLLLFIVACLCVEALAGWLTSLGVHTWYPTLVKPSWTPPNFVFGPVWTALYLLMAVSLWLVWKEPTAYSKRRAYLLFGTQLCLNLIWSGLFFSLHSPWLGLVDLSILYSVLIATMVSFYSFRPLAMYLLVPYLMWSSYAWALNFTIWCLNSLKT